MIQAPHNGAAGPRWGFIDGEKYFPWSLPLRPYGLPLDWIGVTSFDELVDDPEKARRYGQIMWDRMGRGDVLANLAATGLATNAYLYGGDSSYKDWVLEYVGAWQERLAGREVIPDNAGLNGVVGEHLDGRWYGGHYGWAWPHGIESVGSSAVVGAVNATLLSGDRGYLELARNPLDAVLKHAEYRSLGDMGTLTKRWLEHLDPERPTLTIPQRYNDSGWFDYNVMPTQLPIALWHFSRDAVDAERIERLREGSDWDWNAVHDQRNKDEGGHEEPWYEFLAARNPDFPERMLRSALAISAARLETIENDPTDPAVGPDALDIHHWQNVNPVVTEALLQLTTGSPQVLYNGGLTQLHVRYFDALERRPGLPEDVAALVSDIRPDHTVVDLVNLGTQPRSLLLQAGAFHEHALQTVAVDNIPSAPVPGDRLEVNLPPQSEVRLTLTMSMHSRQPTNQSPWEL